MENLTSNQQKSVNKIRDSYDNIQKETGIIVIEVILPLSFSNIYWIDYVWKYTKSLYPDMMLDDKAYMMIVYKINENLELDKDICAQHKGILRTYKKKFLEYIKKFNNCTWSGKTNDKICFDL